MGEPLGTGFGVTLVTVAVGAVGVILGLAVFVLLVAVFPVSAVVLGLFTVGIFLLAAHLLGETIRVITKTALYLYAAGEYVPDAFEGFDFETLGGRAERRATTGAIPSPDVGSRG